jgi:branched-chain amino acid transport system substrate-binding protein
VEASGYAGPADRQKLVEAMEAVTDLPEGAERPQGPMRFDARKHQAFGVQNISKLEGGKLVRVHQTTIEEGLYENDTDYTAMSF